MENNVSIVVFGGTGDLMKRKLVPAFSSLLQQGKLSRDSVIIGVARGDFDDESYKQMLLDSAKEEDRKHIANAEIKFFRGDVSDAKSISGLKEFLEKSENKENNRIFYLATSYKIFPSIVSELKKQGLHEKKGKWTRIVFEKPFGRDLNSSNFLDKEIKKVFSEEQVFRIDHYLAKENVKNILSLRAEDSQFESLLNAESVESIEIIVEEELSVGSRIAYYNDAGAIRDMVQNHLLQVLSLILMELPNKLEAEKIHDAKVKALKSIMVLPAQEHLLGQYASYAQEAEKIGVKNSKTETFVEIMLECKNNRWSGTRIKLRTGKKLGKRLGKIKINFKGTGERIIDIDEKGMDEYALLLSDVVSGSRMLFTRFDELQESWRITDYIESIKDKIKFVVYPDGSVSKRFL